MIAYNDIYEYLRKERYSEQLQPLSKKFILEISSYVSDKKKISSQQESLFSEDIIKTKKQLENAISIFHELMLLRKKKILGLVFVASETGISKRDFENMLDFEKELFDRIMESMKEADKKLSFQFKNEDIAEADKKFEMILFLDNVDEFVGIDGKSMGPFKIGEIANLPKQIADILISDKKAEFVVND